MVKSIDILGFAGSLRRNSYNKALLRAALELLPKDAKLEIFDLEGIPPLECLVAQEHNIIFAKYSFFSTCTQLTDRK